MAQRQFPLGGGLDLPGSAFLVRPSNPNQCQQVLLADDSFGFRRQNKRVPGENVRAAFRIGLMLFDALETQQRLDGHAQFIRSGTTEARGNRQFAMRGIFQRQTIRAQPKDGWLVSDHVVPVQLPAAFPPEACFHAGVVLTEAIAQSIRRGALIRRYGDGLTLVAAINRAACEFRRQRRVKWITRGRWRDLAANAGSKTQLAPFPRAERDVAHADSVGIVQDLDLAIMTAHDQAGLRYGDLEI